MNQQSSSIMTLKELQGRQYLRNSIQESPKSRVRTKTKTYGNLKPPAPTAPIKHCPTPCQISTNPTLKAYLPQFPITQ